MQRVKIWDSFVRLSHWLMVVLLVAMWWTADNDYMEWHLRLAPLLGGLLITRLVWGIIGSQSARFSYFLRGPKSVLQHLRELKNGHYQPSNSHNAAGGWAVMLILLLLLAQFVSGLFAADGYFYEGPLAKTIGSDSAELMTDIHRIVFDLLVAAVVLHLLAIIAYKLRGVSLVAAMLHGYRRNVGAVALRNGLIGIALAAAAAFALFVWIN
jgi:cytochrome b